MGTARTSAGGCYRALGVRPDAGQREIESAFLAWRTARAAGAGDADGYRRAEFAYHLLSEPLARARHDRQLGLRQHPAWTAECAGAVRGALRRAVQDLACGRALTARRRLETAVRLAPEDPDALSYLALATARTGGELHRGLRQAERAVGLRPGDPALLFNLAVVCAAAGLTSRSLAAWAAAWRSVFSVLVPRRRCDGGHRPDPAAQVPSSGWRGDAPRRRPEPATSQARSGGRGRG